MWDVDSAGSKEPVLDVVKICQWDGHFLRDVCHVKVKGWTVFTYTMYLKKGSRHFYL